MTLNAQLARHGESLPARLGSVNSEDTCSCSCSTACCAALRKPANLPSAHGAKRQSSPPPETDKNLLLARPLVLGAARVNRSLERTASDENMTFSWTDPFTSKNNPIELAENAAGVSCTCEWLTFSSPMAAPQRLPNRQAAQRGRHSVKRRVERSRCAGRTIKGVRERPEFQTPGHEKHTFQSHSPTPKVH
jgi:hypothetical protein